MYGFSQHRYGTCSQWRQTHMVMKQGDKHADGMARRPRHWLVEQLMIR